MCNLSAWAEQTLKLVSTESETQTLSFSMKIKNKRQKMSGSIKFLLQHKININDKIHCVSQAY